MNKTKIDWCDSTINPVVGCSRNCPYCYARIMCKRFGKKWGVNDFSKPVFFPERLKDFKSKTPKSIFINSMSDIAFWTPKQLKETITAMLENTQHKYIALTKNFMRYLSIFTIVNLTRELLSGIRKVFFVGETITKQTDIRFDTINGMCVSADFINIEPILEPIDLSEKLSNNVACRLIIIGAETGNRKDKVIPKKEWIDSLVEQADKFGIRVFMKESLKELMGTDFRQDELIWEATK